MQTRSITTLVIGPLRLVHVVEHCRPLQDQAAAQIRPIAKCGPVILTQGKAVAV